MSCVRSGSRVPTSVPKGLTLEYKREIFQLDEELEKLIEIVKEYRERYGELE